MNILLVMLPLSIILLIGAAIAFFWAVEHDQFDDMDTPALLPMTDLPPEAPGDGEVDVERVTIDAQEDRND